MKHKQNSFLCKSFVKPFWRKLLNSWKCSYFLNVSWYKINVHLFPTTCKWCVKRSVFFFGKLMTLNFDALPIIVVSSFALFKNFIFFLQLEQLLITVTIYPAVNRGRVEQIPSYLYDCLQQWRSQYYCFFTFSIILKNEIVIHCCHGYSKS